MKTIDIIDKLDPEDDILLVIRNGKYYRMDEEEFIKSIDEKKCPRCERDLIWQGGESWGCRCGFIVTKKKKEEEHFTILHNKKVRVSIYQGGDPKTFEGAELVADLGEMDYPPDLSKFEIELEKDKLYAIVMKFGDGTTISRIGERDTTKDGSKSYIKHETINCPMCNPGLEEEPTNHNEQGEVKRPREVSCQCEKPYAYKDSRGWHCAECGLQIKEKQDQGEECPECEEKDDTDPFEGIPF